MNKRLLSAVLLLMAFSVSVFAQSLDFKADGATVSMTDDDETVCDVPEQPASFQGDLYAWLAQNVRYPKSCQERNVQGRVMIQFIINKDGSVSDAKVLKSPDEDLSKEGLRVVRSMPKWNPALLKGKPVRMRYVLPLMFRLPDPQPETK